MFRKKRCDTNNYPPLAFKFKLPWKSIFGTLILLCTLISQAGTYVVTYSGTGNKDGITYANSGGYRTSPPGNGASCGGIIIATFTWTPSTDPRPKHIVITETCVASYENTGGPATVTGTCNNDLEGGDSLVAYGSRGKASGLTSSNVRIPHYTPMDDPAATFTITRTPTATASASSMIPPPPPTPTPMVSYQASASIVDIAFDGILAPTQKKILIGQKFVATVTGAPSGSSYSWSLSGGSPFANYTASSSTATYTGWSSINNASTVCYFAKPAKSATISATVSLPSSTSTLTVSDEVEIDEPTSTAHLQQGVPTLGTITPSTGVISPTTTTPDTVGLWNTTYDGHTKSIFFIGQVKTPSEFIHLGDAGQWEWTQLVTKVTRWAKYSDGHYEDGDNFDSTLTGATTQAMLDTNQPYDGYWSTANDTSDYEEDAPCITWSSGGVEALDDQTFDLYMMYLAPGVAKLVPLKKWTWYWQAHVIQGTTDWSFATPPSQGFSAETDYPNHPIWTDNAANHSGFHRR